jgi:DNA-binding transcriptional ArsR family regulator
MRSTAIADIARVMANPTGAAVLEALLSDRVLSVTALARELGSPRSTVSEAVGALEAAGLVQRRREGRASLLCLAGVDVADALEALGRLADPPVPIGLRAHSRMAALRHARTCYDHLAGELGVRIADGFLSAGVIEAADDGDWRIAGDGLDRLAALGLSPALFAPGRRRPLVRACLDWTERRPHVAGRLGAAICASWLDSGMVRRLPGSRAVSVTPAAERWLDRCRTQDRAR